MFQITNGDDKLGEYTNLKAALERMNLSSQLKKGKRINTVIVWRFLDQVS